jgi:peroxiredoxin Q/BCP
LRDDIERFTSAGARLATVAPESPADVEKFVRANAYPFPLLADPDHTVFDAYDVVNTMMSLGQRPALFVIDGDGTVRFDSIGTQQWQIPTNDNVLKVLATL